MKKIFLLVAALAAFTFTSCNSDDDAQGLVGNGEMENVTLTVGIDNGVKTKAETALPAVIPSGYKARYIVEIWKGSSIFSRIEQASTDITNPNVFSLSVPKGVSYKLVVWVDFINASKTATNGLYTDEFYTTSTTDKGLSAIEQKNITTGTWTPAQDAFFASVDWTDASRPTSIIAKRPFARLNVIALDQASWENLKIADATRSFTIKTTYTGVPKTFDATAGTVTDTQNIVSSQSTTSSGSTTYTYTADNNIFYSGLVFAPTVSELYSIQLDLTMQVDGTNKYEPVYAISNVPLQRNYQTNIIGNLIVGNTDFTIYVDEGYLTPINSYNFDQYGRALDTNRKLITQWHTPSNTLVLNAVSDVSTSLIPSASYSSVKQLILIGANTAAYTAIQTVISAMTSGVIDLSAETGTPSFTLTGWTETSTGSKIWTK